MIQKLKDLWIWLFTPAFDYPPEGTAARIFFKLARIPFMLWNTITYAPRRRNAAERIAESLVGLLIVLYAPTWTGVLVGLAAELMFFETVELMGWAGYYWERGPRDGESPDNDGYWAE